MKPTMIKYACIFFILTQTSGNVLKGRHLTVATFHQPPDLYITFDNRTGRAKYEGPFVNVVEWLSRRLQFNYTLVPIKSVVNPSTNKTMEASQANVVQYGITEEMDLLVPHISLSRARYRLLDFTVCTASVPSGFLLPAPHIRSFIWEPVMCFSWTVWLLMAVSAVVVAGTLWFISPARYGNTMHDQLFQIISLMLGQGELSRWGVFSYKLKFRVLIGALVLSLFVLLNAYNNILISKLTSPMMEKYPPGSEELIESSNMIYIVTKHGIGEEIIMTATSGPLKKLGDFFRKNPQYLVSDIKSAYDFVASGCCAFSHLMPFIKINVYEDYKTTGKCRFSLGNSVSGYGFMGLVLHKNSPYTAAISLELLQMMELGLLSKWSQPFSDPPMPCLKKAKVTAQRRVLGLSDLRFPFVLLGIGSGISLMVFIIEVLAKRFRRAELGATRRCPN